MNIRNRYGETALHVAVANGDTDCVHAIVTAIEPSKKEDGAETPLPIIRNGLLPSSPLPVDLEIRNYEGK